MNDNQKGSRTKTGKSKKIKFKRSKDFSPDKLKQKEKRQIKRNRKEKLDLLRLDELAEVDELVEIYKGTGSPVPYNYTGYQPSLV